MITRHLRTSLQLIDNYARGVLGLRSAVQKLHAMNAFLLTPTHVDFVLVCIKAQMYEVAYTELAEQPLLKIDPMVNGLKPVDYLSFFYYLGTVCIAKRDYVKAIESMQVVLTCPSSILSAVQIEAYKKFIILSLLLHSEIIALPANLVNLRLMEELKKVTTAYVALARGFTAHVETGVKTLVQTIQSNFQRYERDKNVGIIKRLVDALNKRNIKRLTNTYLRLSLSDIATRANLESPARAEEFVREMVSRFAKEMSGCGGEGLRGRERESVRV